jgi:uncharacterized protein YcnI
MTPRTQLVAVHTLRAFAVGSALIAASAHSAAAHAVVFPAEAPTGAYQKYVLRVPNERAFATTRVVITFPTGVRVISFDEVGGWALETASDNDGATFTAATWTGTLPVGRFVEFGFIGVNPAEPLTLKWDVIQHYADGTVVEWTGPENSSTPASLTRVVAPLDDASPSPSSGSSGVLLGGIALALAMISLGLALRPRQRS